MAEHQTRQDDFNELMKQRAIIFAECEKMASFEWSDDYPDFGLEEDEIDAICSNLDEIAELAELYWEQDNSEKVRGLACPTACTSAATQLRAIFDIPENDHVNDAAFDHKYLDDYSAPKSDERKGCFLQALRGDHPIWDGLPRFRKEYNSPTGRLEALLSLRKEGVRLHNDGGTGLMWVLLDPWNGPPIQPSEHRIALRDLRMITPLAVRLIIRGFGERVRNTAPSKAGVGDLPTMVRRYPFSIRSLDDKSAGWWSGKQRLCCGHLKDIRHQHRLLNDRPVAVPKNSKPLDKN